MSKRRNPFRLAKFDQEPFRRIYDTNVVGLSLSDFKGHFLQANDEALRILGYERQDLEAGALDWKALTPTEHMHKDLAAMDQMRSHGSHLPFEKEYIRKDGSRVPVLVAFSLLEGDLAFGTIVDLTSRKEMERRLQSVKRSTNDAVFKELHESNNYLSVVVMQTELALMATSEEHLRHRLTEIMRSAENAIQSNRTLERQLRETS